MVGYRTNIWRHVYPSTEVCFQFKITVRVGYTTVMPVLFLIIWLTSGRLRFMNMNGYKRLTTIWSLLSKYFGRIEGRSLTISNATKTSLASQWPRACSSRTPAPLFPGKVKAPLFVPSQTRFLDRYPFKAYCTDQ